MTPQEFKNQYGTLQQIVEAFANIRLAKEENGTCIHCGATKEKLKAVKDRQCVQCSSCKRQTYVLAHTVLERIKIPLDVFMEILYEIVCSRTIISAQHIHMKYGISYSGAYNMCKRVHLLMGIAVSKVRLSGLVEIDESGVSIGRLGLSRYFRFKEGRGKQNSQSIMVMVEKPTRNGRQTSGNAIAYLVDDCSAEKLIEKIQLHLTPSEDLTIVTDEWAGYNSLRRLGYKHMIVNHSRYEFKSPSGFTTNTAENYWRNLKDSLSALRRVTRRELNRYIQARNFQHCYRHLTNHEKLLQLLQALPPLYQAYRDRNSNNAA